MAHYAAITNAWSVLKPCLSIASALIVSATVDTAEAQDFDGYYAGLSLGAYNAGSNETERLSSTGGISDIFNYNGSGGVFAVHIGRNWQKDARLFGLEASVSSGETINLFFDPDNRYSYNSEFVLDLTARYGFLVDPITQIFVTTGLSVEKTTYDWTFFGTSDKDQITQTGFRLGVGMEQSISASGSLRLSLDLHNRISGSFASDILPGFVYENNTSALSVSVGYLHYFD